MNFGTHFRAAAKRLLSKSQLETLRLSRLRRPRSFFGELARPTPIGLEFGFDVGTPVDRIYIERFLGDHRPLIRGRVLEVVDSAYTRKFGGANVLQADVIDVNRGNPAATIIADLAELPTSLADSYDCIILTQVLHLIFDMPAAIRCAYMALRPGGSLLFTVPGISPIDRYGTADSWYWSLTAQSARRLTEQTFPAPVEVAVFGNVFAALCLLHGLAAEEVPMSLLDPTDEFIPVTVAVAAKKPL